MPTYKETLNFLFTQLPAYHKIGHLAYKADLNNIILLCNEINNPQNNLKCIHIAGTNGKGSVSSFIASCLQEAGYKTGLFTSPHLIDFRERIRINGQMISKKYITTFIEKYKNLITNVKPSFFEWTTAIAFDYFNKNNVDFAVIETGMGGRLDATNIINPLISVITNISYDHTQFLGNTLEKIATEKAGIIKPNIPVIIGEKHEETTNVFIKKASSCNSNIYFAEELVSIKEYSLRIDKLLIKCNIWGTDFNIKSPLAGIYQLKNIPTALLTILILKKMGYEINKKDILKGFSNVISNTGITGRWTILHKHPLIICDTAHNEDGIKNIANQLSKHIYNYKKIHFVLGFVEDKDVVKILKSLNFPNANYYFCEPSIPRALKINALREKSQFIAPISSYFKKVTTAFKAAINNASYNDIIYIGGSTFVVADFLKFYNKK